MATLITKNSQTAGAVPSAASLSVGELAVNTADGKLYTEHTGGVVKEIIPSTVVDGGITTNKIANNSVTVAKISATGTPSSTTYLSGDGSWKSVSGGFAGATVNASSATDLVLTSTSAQTQIVTPQDATKAIILPDATTLTTLGTPVYTFINRGGQISIKNNAGTIISVLPSNVTMLVTLVSNSTAAGSWSFNSTSTLVAAVAENLVTQIPATVYFGSQLEFYRYGGDGNRQHFPSRIMWLSDTQFVVVQPWGTTSGRGFASLVGTVSGTSVTFGSEQRYTLSSQITQNVDWSVPSYDVIRMSNTTYLIVMTGAGTNWTIPSGPYGQTVEYYYNRIIGCTVSGSSVSYTDLVIGAESSSYRSPACPQVTRLTDTTALLICNPNSGQVWNNPYNGGTPQAAILTFSGGSLTRSGQVNFGQANAATGQTYGFYQVLETNPLISANQVLVRNIAGAQLNTWIATINGGSISMQQATVVGTNPNIVHYNFAPIVRNSLGELVLLGGSSVRLITISGTTVTLGDPVSTSMSTANGAQNTDNLAYIDLSPNNTICVSGLLYSRITPTAYSNLGVTYYAVQPGSFNFRYQTLNPSGTKLLGVNNNSSVAIFSAPVGV